MYHLKSVLMHTGGAYGGHYFCYLQAAGRDSPWIKYNDAVVTELTDDEAAAAAEATGARTLARSLALSLYVCYLCARTRALRSDSCVPPRCWNVAESGHNQHFQARRCASGVYHTERAKH